MIKDLIDIYLIFFRMGAVTFGGGYAMVALLQNEFVEEKKWVTKEEFLDMVAIAESTPGPVAVNSATYIGYKIEEHRRQHPDERLLVAGRTAGAEPQRCGLSEPLAAARRAGRGTRRAGNRWEMRSNVLIDTAFRVVRGDVYARRWLFDPSGEAPWATYTRRRYEGGPGANLPVFCYFR